MQEYPPAFFVSYWSIFARMCMICTLCTGNVHDLHVTFRRFVRKIEAGQARLQTIKRSEVS